VQNQGAFAAFPREYIKVPGYEHGSQKACCLVDVDKAWKPVQIFVKEIEVTEKTYGREKQNDPQ